MAACKKAGWRSLTWTAHLPQSDRNVTTLCFLGATGTLQYVACRHVVPLLQAKYTDIPVIFVAQNFGVKLLTCPRDISILCRSGTEAFVASCACKIVACPTSFIADRDPLLLRSFCSCRPLPTVEPCDAKPAPRAEHQVVSAHHAFEEWEDIALGEFDEPT